MPGIIGKKIGMTSIFGADNRSIACTLIEAGPCFVTQIKTVEKDQYEAVQIGYAEAKEKRVTQQMKGHFAKAGVTPCKIVKEFDFNTKEVKLGQEITVSIFEEGTKVNIVGTSKGKGFQGVVKRHGFGGVGGQTHGQHNRLRHPGSMGACSFPSRVFKGKKLGGRTGGESVQMQNLQIIKIIPEKNLILVSGSIPGANGSFVYLQK